MRPAAIEQFRLRVTVFSSRATAGHLALPQPFGPDYRWQPPRGVQADGVERVISFFAAERFYPFLRRIPLIVSFDNTYTCRVTEKAK